MENSVYESFDKWHKDEIDWLDEDGHLDCISEYKKSNKVLDGLIEEAVLNKEYAQAAIYSSFLKTNSFKISNHFAELDKISRSNKILDQVAQTIEKQMGEESN